MKLDLLCFNKIAGCKYVSFTARKAEYRILLSSSTDGSILSNINDNQELKINVLYGEYIPVVQLAPVQPELQVQTLGLVQTPPR